MNFQKFQVELGERSYPILIGEGTLQTLVEELHRVVPKTNHAVIAFDDKVHAIAEAVSVCLRDANWRTDMLSIPAGEQSKCIDQLGKLWQAMLNCRTDRGSVVIAVGGGVVGDLAGFAAASFARGLKLVQVPTTLLSQVDSSVGGKTGINLVGAKNMVGAFWQPSLVVIDSTTLASLPQREYVSGLAEIVKYGVILMPELFEYLENNVDNLLARNAAVLQHVVLESCRAKAMVVQIDERETTGLRAILNYGHTFAHAIESTHGYGKFLHGEAVAIGMSMAAHLANLLGRVDKHFVVRQNRLLDLLGLPTTLEHADLDALWKAMLSDKKVEHGSLRFVLPDRLGHVELVEKVPRGLAETAIRESVR